MVVLKHKYRDGRDWTVQTRECSGKEKPDIQAIDISSLITGSGIEVVDILKVDIERAERELFSHGYEKWLSKIRNIAIELHDEECSSVFLKPSQVIIMNCQDQGS